MLVILATASSVVQVALAMNLKFVMAAALPSQWPTGGQLMIESIAGPEEPY